MEIVSPAAQNLEKVRWYSWQFFLSSGFHVGGKIAAVFGARVVGMRGIRRTCPARVLPDASALIPMETQTPERIRGGAVAGLWKFQPNPFADNLRQFVLLRQLRPQEIQNFLRRQFAVGVVLGKCPLLFRAG